MCPHRNRCIGSLREILGVKVPENVLNSTIAPVGSEGNAVKGNHEGAVGICHVEKVSLELHLTQAGTLTGECWGGRRPRLCGWLQKGLTQGWLLAWASSSGC